MIAARQLAAEGLGTAGLLAIVVGSGIAGERLAGGSDALALLANSAATGAGLFVLIATLGPVSGAHFNPAVTLVLALRKHFPWPQVPSYIAVQAVGALVGVTVAHVMFDLPLLTSSAHVRTGIGQWTSEVVATFGLVLTICLARRRGAVVVGALVACYIAAAYWFTASTAFVNPAATLARTATNTFAGVRPRDAPAFVIAQLLGAALAWLTCRMLRK